jgi:hypothetical protein
MLRYAAHFISTMIDSVDRRRATVSAEIEVAKGESVPQRTINRIWIGIMSAIERYSGVIAFFV